MYCDWFTNGTYLRNRSPTKAVDGMTPYEAWHDIKPRVDRLRVFGCDAYMHISKDERGKLDPKSKKCTLLGYGRETKGYRLFDITRQKVVHCRDVQFNEEEKKDSNNAPNNFNTHVEVELQCDPDLTHDNHEASDVAPTEESEIEPVVRRSTRERHPPDYFRIHSTCLTFQQDPSSFEEATTCSNKSEWIKERTQVVKILSQNFYFLCPYTIWQTKFIVYQSKTSPAFINSGQNLVVVAHSIFFFFMVEFDNFINILSSLAKMSSYFHFIS